jgi:4-hydroxyacetophenone monooxygenase
LHQAEPAEPLSERISRLDDAALRGILAEADLPPLLAALAHATGDARLLAPELRPRIGMVGATLLPQGGMSDEAQAKARALALSALRRLAAGTTPIDIAAPGALAPLMEFITGPIEADYVPLLSQELGIHDGAAPAWSARALAPGRDFKVAIVGSGMSGLIAAYRLAQAGVDFAMFDRNPDIGGTWLVNTYPGCRLDTSNFGYSYSFAQKTDWRQQFSDRAAIHAYLAGVADAAGLRRSIRFETEVEALIFDDLDAMWTVHLRNKAGETRAERFNAVISAVGQLNRPSIPAFPGRDDFAGPAFHTAEWDHGVDLKGKRVALIGTGASAIQVAPAIAEEAAALDIFQRTPTWFVPTPSYLKEIGPGMSWLLANVPYYGRWYRFYLFWRGVEGRRPYMQVDPAWTRSGSVSAENEQLRQALKLYLEEQFADRPDLLPHVVPTYPPGAKRMPRDDGTWARTLKKPNVALVTEAIAGIEAGGIRTADGALHEADVIVYGTGFRASEFLTPMKVKGRGGADLHDYWDGDARAYLGVTIPGFPNLFCLYGPNTNLVFNGSLVMFSECGAHYAVDCIRTLIETGHRAMNVTPEAYRVYNERIDAENALMSWGASDVNSWYKNARGRVTQNWPLPSLDYWRWTRRAAPFDYDFS